MLQLQHQDYQWAPYLFALRDLRNSRLVIRFRCNCHGPHVGTGQFKPVEQTVDREQRFCPVCTCASGTAEDEHHFVFDCSAYCSIRDRFTAIFWGPAHVLSSFFSWQWPCGHAKFWHEYFAHRNLLCPHTLCIMLAMIQTRRLNRDYMTWRTTRPISFDQEQLLVHDGVLISNKQSKQVVCFWSESVVEDEIDGWDRS